mgnify:CR=1 FL=1
MFHASVSPGCANTPTNVCLIGDRLHSPAAIPPVSELYEKGFYRQTREVAQVNQELNDFFLTREVGQKVQELNYFFLTREVSQVVQELNYFFLTCGVYQVTQEL